MEASSDQIKRSISAIEESLREADSYYLRYEYQEGDEDDRELARYYAERAFTQALVLAERLQLNETYRKLEQLLESAKRDEHGLVSSKMGPEDPYLVWPSRLRTYVDAIADAYGLNETGISELRNLKNAVRRTLYSICDTAVFTSLPASEDDVHKRVEAILKCHYADLLSKPALSKPLKNFIPDTGIPSLTTLIEFKFVTSKSQAKPIVDQLLADSRGYRSAQWRNLLIVVYETHRVFPEDDWVKLLRECGMGADYDVVVLSGDARQPSKPKKAAKKTG